MIKLVHENRIYKGRKYINKEKNNEKHMPAIQNI